MSAAAGQEYGRPSSERPGPAAGEHGCQGAGRGTLGHGHTGSDEFTVSAIEGWAASDLRIRFGPREMRELAGTGQRGVEMSEQHDLHGPVVSWTGGDQEVGPILVEGVEVPCEVWSDALALVSEALSELALAAGRARRLHHQTGQIDEFVLADSVAGPTGCCGNAHRAILDSRRSAALAATPPAAWIFQPLFASGWATL